MAASKLSWNPVFLHEWWLLRPGSDGLAVGGFASTDADAVIEFRSAAVAKRHDNTTLETVDGITILLSDFIKRSRTLESGFSPQVCSHFLSGFPFDWETYAAPDLGNESSEGFSQGSVYCLEEKNSSNCDLPLIWRRDQIFFDDSKNYLLSICSNILGENSGAGISRRSKCSSAFSATGRGFL